MITARKAILNFECGRNPWCDYLNETFSAVLSHGTINLVCSSNF